MTALQFYRRAAGEACKDLVAVVRSLVSGSTFKLLSTRGDSKERLQFVGKKELGRAPSRRHLTWGMCGMVRLLLKGKL